MQEYTALDYFFLQNAVFGETDEVKLLVGRVNLEVCDSHASTALHIASLNGQEDLVRILLDSGANIHARDCELDTALHCAAMNGHLSVCAALVSRGANLFARNCVHQSALDYALQMRQPLIARMLQGEITKRVLMALRSAQEVRRVGEKSPLRALPRELCRVLGTYLQ